MTKGLLNKDKGFTIIEVVLVLAIAGLIFLIVFLALPQLQRSRRDTQRRSDAGRFLAAMESYASNNNGQYPMNGTDCTSVIDDYIKAGGSDVFADPSEGDYSCSWTTADPSGPSSSINVHDSLTCDGGGSSRDVAVKIGLEEGGFYCQDNR